MRPMRARAFTAGMQLGRPYGIPSYNAICTRCESMFRAPIIKPRDDGPIYCPDCAVYHSSRNRDQDLDQEV